jgi:hypothetical protein
VLRPPRTGPTDTSPPQGGPVLAGRLVAGALTAGLVLGMALGPPAAAAPTAPTAPSTCSPAALAAARDQTLRALTRRITRLHDLSSAVGASTGLTTADRSTLNADLSGDLAALTALGQKVPADTTCAEVSADAQAMVGDYRVFLLMSPQVHLAVAADTEAQMASVLMGLEPKISQRITAAQQQGESVGPAQDTFSDFQNQVATAAQSSAGISAAVLALTPASIPASRTTLVHARTSLLAGRTALVKARSDLRRLKEDAGR